MSFDEEYIDPHEECAHEIARLNALVKALEEQVRALREALEA